ncbi:MAG TPA: hypothetical protein PLV31_01955 [Gammaproteobacteria bacterium]|nr:hypothetical protein [Gammaproteobacteria bacterium]HRA42436.1 hypothetical protein [Gammaproteobacteria bacterium]
MINERIKVMEHIASTHESRILTALEHLKNTFPLTEESVGHLSDDQLLNIEMLTSRFAKLQDYLGTKVFDIFFEVEQENVDGFTMIDKLNKLEKLGIINDAHQWRDMRGARNIVEHEYPDNPLLIASNLNKIHDMIPFLIAIKRRIFEKVRKI